MGGTGPMDLNGDRIGDGHLPVRNPKSKDIGADTG